MATKLYPYLNLRTSVEGTAVANHSGMGFWDLDTTQGGLFLGQLVDSTGAFFNNNSSGTITGPVNGLIQSLSLSYPLSAPVTITGTVTFNFWSSESNTLANVGLIARVLALKPDSTFVTICAESAWNSGGELSTTAAARNWTTTPTTTSLDIGDRICLCWGYDDAGGTMASGFLVNIWTEGTPGGTTGDSWVQFTETLSFDTTTPGGTSIFLTDSAAAIDPGGSSVDSKEAWTSRGAGAVSAVMNTANGPIALGTNQWTTSAGGNTIEWYSRRLGAVTLQGKVYCKVRAFESNGAIFASCVVEIARVDEDGSNPVIWARGVLANLTVHFVTALGTSELTREAYLSGNPLGCNGHRLRFRVYCDDVYLTAPSGPQTAGGTATLKYAGAAGATGDTFFTFSQTLTEFVAPGPVDTPSLVPLAQVY